MRRFTIKFKRYSLDKNSTAVESNLSFQNLKSVLDTVPDLDNDEIECIVALQVGESLSLDDTTIIRTV